MSAARAWRQAVYGFFGALVALTLVQCSKDEDDHDDTTNLEIASASGLVGDAVNGGTVTRRAAVADRDTCASRAFSACDSSNTRTRSFSASGGDEDACTRGRDNGLRVFGSATLSFDSSASCADFDAATSGNVVRTVSNHYVQRGLNGSKVLIYTAPGTVAGRNLGDGDLRDFTGTMRSGGVTVTKTGASTATVDITGIHRRRVNPNGRFAFWHTLYTASGSPLTVTITGSQRTVNGTIYIAHNRIGRVVTKTLTDVVYDTSCRHPIGGSSKYVYKTDKDRNVEFVITYSANCGNAALAETEASTVPVDLEDGQD